jgi:hypothetical protein
LTSQDFLDGQLHLLPVHGVGDLSDGQDQGGNVPINTKGTKLYKNYKKGVFTFCDALIHHLGKEQNWF